MVRVSTAGSGSVQLCEPDQDQDGTVLVNLQVSFCQTFLFGWSRTDCRSVVPQLSPCGFCVLRLQCWIPGCRAALDLEHEATCLLCLWPLTFFLYHLLKCAGQTPDVFSCGTRTD